MYAVVKAGGKQHKVAVGDVVEVNRLEGDAGDSISLPALLVVDGSDVTTEGSALAKITVTGEIVGHHKGPKIKILKYKNKTGYRKRIGHRQHLTELLVTEIDDGKPKKKQSAKPAAKSDTKSGVDSDTESAETSPAAKKTASAKSTRAESTTAKASAGKATSDKSATAKSTEKAESTTADSKPSAGKAASASKANTATTTTASKATKATKSEANTASKSTDEKGD